MNTKRKLKYLSLALGACAALPAAGQDAPPPAGEGRQLMLEEVVVHARRREERLQDVPVSMTVFSQAEISNRNIVNAGDLATYTPSLSVNDRFGADNTSFSIRGFTEEMRTTASVGVYFAEVVGARGGNTTSSGNGAGPGAFFDVQSVQVLKGPQGTLFGRNTTGGAVLVMPQKPTDEFEGYVEVSGGNYDMRRLEAVVNVPISDRVRVRLGVDDHERDGYLENLGSAGPRDMANLDYTAFRASMVVDITDRLENYTIFSHTDSSNNGSAGLILDCHPDPTYRFASFCHQQQADMGDADFHGFKSNKRANKSSVDQWQLINHLTWEVSDKLTVKNILSYTELETELVGPVFATNFYLNGVPFGMTSSDLVAPGVPTTNQKTYVGELQLLGMSFNDRLDWQAGLYYERSKPDGDAGSRPTRGVDCIDPMSGNPNDWACLGVLGPGSTITQQFGEVEYDNRALYGQATYSFSDRLKLTAGVRYTWDETTGVAGAINHGGFPADGYGPPSVTECINPLGTLPDCWVSLKTKSEEPTWVLGIDYFPVQDVMLYAKYSRGYRQGNVNLFGAPGFQVHDPETLDAYEIGAKTSFYGPVPGTFNIALFYNELEDMQLQTGFAGIVNTTGILNAGKAVMQGAEIDASLNVFDNVRLDVGYAYLDTEIKSVAMPPPPPPGLMIIPAAVEGDPTPWSPEHKLTATLSYQVPVRPEMGDLSVALNYVYVDSQLVSTGTPYGVLPSYDLFNLSANWRGIAGSGFDLSVFVNNLTDEEYYTNVYGNYQSFGVEFYNPGAPRTYGARLRYSF